MAGRKRSVSTKLLSLFLSWHLHFCTFSINLDWAPSLLFFLIVLPSTIYVFVRVLLSRREAERFLLLSFLTSIAFSRSYTGEGDLEFGHSNNTSSSGSSSFLLQPGFPSGISLSLKVVLASEIFLWKISLTKLLIIFMRRGVLCLS